MTTEELLALLPIILTATASILVMLGIAVRRSEIQTINLTLLGLFAALASLPFISDVLPQQVTPLLIMDDFSLFHRSDPRQRRCRDLPVQGLFLRTGRAE